MTNPDIASRPATVSDSRQRAGQCLVNEGSAPFRCIVIGDHEPNDVCVYPDSNKVLVRKLDRAIFRDGERLDYWYAERADEPVKQR